jgi:7-cyano-7-deazaguanine synthase
VMDLNGYGKLVPSGLTNVTLRVNEDAFLPGRNLLFLLAGSAYAYQQNFTRVAIGLLSEKTSIFPDQTIKFIEMTQQLISYIMDREIVIIAPLMEYTKRDVIELAKRKGISGTYSCHAGTAEPCGQCVSCLERIKSSQ